MYFHQPNWSFQGTPDKGPRFGNALWAPLNYGVRLLQ
jgi:hypothetical protein